MNSLFDEARIAIHAVWRRRWLALGVAWGVALIGWTVVAMIPNSYESHARVSVDLQSILQSKIGIAETDQQRGIDRVRQTLSSTVNLAKVVKGTDLGLKATSDAEVAGQAAMLQQAITIKSTQDNIIELSAKIGGGGRSDASNSRIAKQVVQKLIDVFVEQNMAGDRDETSTTIKFLDGELARRQTQLQEAEQKKVDFAQKYMGLLPGVGSVSQRLESARAELNTVESNLVSAQSSLAAMNGQMASTPATVPAPNYGGGTGNPIAGQIATLQGQLADAQAKGWTDAHPDVIAMKAQIARLRPMARTSGGGGGAGSMANPLYVTLRSMQADKAANVSALVARRAQLQSQMAQFTASQAQEPEVAAEQAQLERDYDVLKQQYDKLLGDREDVRLRSDVSTKTDPIKFSIIDPPSAAKVPASPNRPMLLFGVLIVAVGAGVGGAFALGQLKATYPTAKRLAAASGMTVLGSISEVVTEAERAIRAKHLRWFAGGSGALAGCLALLLVIEFVQRGLVA